MFHRFTQIETISRTILSTIIESPDIHDTRKKFQRILLNVDLYMNK